MNLITKSVLFLLFSLLLCSCNNQSDSVTDTTLNIEKLKAFDIRGTIDETYTFNYDDKLDDISGLKVEEIYSKGKCEYSSVSRAKFDISIDKNSICLYKTNFRNKHKTYNGILSLSFSDISKNLLPLISKSVISGETVTIDLTDELGPQHPSGAHLNDEAVLINIDNSEIVKIRADPANELLTVTIPSPGVYRLLYYFTDDDIVYPGVIYFVSTYDENRDILAHDQIIDVSVGKSVTIEPSKFIDNIEGQDVLTTLDAFSFGDVDVSDIIDDKKFTIKTKYSGKFDVFYSVSDGRGSVIFGSIRLMSFGSENGLENIVGDDFTFHFTENLHEAVLNGRLSYTSVYQENGITGIKGVDYPTYDLNIARSICVLRNLRLPNETDIRSLWNKEGNLYDGINHRKFPVGVPYIFDDGGKGGLFDFVEGISLPISSAIKPSGYVLCLGDTYKGIKISSRDVINLGEKEHLTVIAHQESKPMDISVDIKYWSVSDVNRATVSNGGVLTPIKIGKVDVYVYDYDGNKDVKSIEIL
ncbi:hypothetical protein [Vibrio owensii]|uniref:hypothetical protein n=1 Tax=Vibrio owensii TaxID=696485 RepID=UPI004067BDC8